MGLTTASMRQFGMSDNPTSHRVKSDHYEGPASGGTSYQSGFRTTAQTATAFQTSHLSQQAGRPLSLSGQTRAGTFNWDAGSSSPGFPGASN